jgi:hypothetical protein
MNLTTKLVLVLAAAAAACAVRADTSDDSDLAVGILGQRYGSFSFTDQSVEHATNDLYNVDFGLNIPITSYLDVGGDFAYAFFKHVGLERHSYLGEVYATGYWAFKGLKPFGTLTIGNEWDDLNAPGGFLDTPNYGIYAVTAGVEIPTHPASITPYVTHQDDLRASKKSAQANDYGVEINYWFRTNKSWGIFADLGYQQVLHSIYDSWYYTIGLRERF